MPPSEVVAGPSLRLMTASWTMMMLGGDPPCSAPSGEGAGDCTVMKLTTTRSWWGRGDGGREGHYIGDCDIA